MKKKCIVLALIGVAAFSARAQKVFTAANYEQATKFLGFNTNKLVYNSDVRPTWLPDGKMWYATTTATGKQYTLVNTADGSKKTAGDLKSLLPDAVEKPMGFGRRGGGGGNEIMSPDGKKAAFIRDWNLWVRDVESKKETQLTTDGVKDFGYATDNAGWTHSDRAIILWSPDSKKIATFQQDQRNVSDMYVASTKVGGPKLEAWKYPLPVDKEIIQIQRVIIEVDQPKVIRLKIPADPRRGTLCDDISCSGAFDDNEWNADGSKLAFVSTSRDHKVEKMRIADAATGDVKEIFTETVTTQFESGQGSINWHFLAASNQIIWYSERDDWGHLYMYDATTGKVNTQITKGDFVVTRLLKVDEKNKVLFFEANGREKGARPLFQPFLPCRFYW
ncbi:MAG: DPP IV N-terminal domain-containing protein [Ferruginibacter sp.]